MDTTLAGQGYLTDTAVSMPHLQLVDEAEVLIPLQLDGDETSYSDAELLRDARLALWEHQMQGGQIVGSTLSVAVALEVAA